jgi:hypothetical protein
MVMVVVVIIAFVVTVAVMSGIVTAAGIASFAPAIGRHSRVVGGRRLRGIARLHVTAVIHRGRTWRARHRDREKSKHAPSHQHGWPPSLILVTTLTRLVNEETHTRRR